MILAQTPRIRIRQLTVSDAAFILELFNQPTFLRYIGDKGVHSLACAEHYLRSGPLASYASSGLHMYLVEERGTDRSLGLCGLIDRDELPGIDLGFALSSEHLGKGFASEAARAVIALARAHFKLTELFALTHPDNTASQKCLLKLGFAFKETLNADGFAENSKLFHLTL
ncbi:MAG: GNAT family N-acetyltransferase [Pseudomonadales bacterium]